MRSQGCNFKTSTDLKLWITILYVKQQKTEYAESFRWFFRKVRRFHFQVLLDDEGSKDPFVTERLKAAQIQGYIEDTKGSF